MNDKVLCPWCGTEMSDGWHENGLGRFGNYLCQECFAKSPDVAWPLGLPKQQFDMLNKAAALRRYTPRLKPMTLEASIEEKAVWIEQKTNEPENNLTPSLFGWQNKGRWVVFIEQPGEDDDDGGKIVGYNPYDYGRTWRCWSRKPTDEERSAAEWEK